MNARVPVAQPIHMDLRGRDHSGEKGWRQVLWLFAELQHRRWKAGQHCSSANPAFDSSLQGFAESYGIGANDLVRLADT